MATVFSHAVVGLAAASVGAARGTPARFWILSAVCAVLPDVDVLAFRFGIPYAGMLGHRGFFHSLPFALTVGILATTLFFRNEPTFSHKWLLLCGYFFLVTATHGILDACTSGGLGVALFAPLDGTRYFFPWTPIKVSPLGVRAFFSDWGVKVLASEVLLIWIPSMAVLAAGRIFHHARQ
jgi:inner membrane protein